MLRRGRRFGFFVGALAGCLCGAVSALAVFYASFALFCVGVSFWGICWSFGQFYRYAALEVVSPKFKGMAISTVLAGSVVGVIVGPEIAIHVSTLERSGRYENAYLAISVACALLAAVVSRLKVDVPKPRKENNDVALLKVVYQPAVAAGLVNGIVGFSVMVFVMTAAPLAIVHMGHSAGDAVNLIRWHLLGMYGPSFVTGLLVDRFGAIRIAWIGLATLSISVLLPLSGISIHHFGVGLVLLGIGWNFVYITSTIFISSTEDGPAKAKAQAISEFLINFAVAAVAFLAGGVFALAGWSVVNYVALPFIAFPVAATVRLALDRRLGPSS
jgi:MFS family permease